jgi:hypothetical protein
MDLVLAERASAEQLRRPAAPLERHHRLAVAQEQACFAERPASPADDDGAVHRHGHQRALGGIHAGGDGEIEPWIRLVAGGAREDPEHDPRPLSPAVAAGGAFHASTQPPAHQVHAGACQRLAHLRGHVLAIGARLAVADHPDDRPAPACLPVLFLLHELKMGHAAGTG